MTPQQTKIEQAAKHLEIVFAYEREQSKTQRSAYLDRAISELLEALKPKEQKV